MNKSSYRSASHITAFFKIADLSQDLLSKGSCGAGFNIQRGVKTEITLANSSDHEIFIDNNKITIQSASITKSVLDEIEKTIKRTIPALTIKYTFEVPLGAGYGTSASVALTTAFAINDVLSLDIEELVLWQIAHKAEILNKTGLGDILGLYAKSAFEIRVQEGAPGVGKVISPQIDVTEYDLYTLSFGPLSKKDILTDPIKRSKITEIGSVCLEKFQTNQTFENFCNLALDFSKAIDLLPDNLWKIVNSLPRTIKGSQIMLGESLFFFIPKNTLLPHIQSFVLIKESLTDNVLQKLS